jgi:pilus assembly protein Flp/PilA
MHNAGLYSSQSSTGETCGDLARLHRDTRGVTAIEYALIAALIAVAAIAAFSLVGTNLSSTFSYVANCL